MNPVGAIDEGEMLGSLRRFLFRERRSLNSSRIKSG
jgi:hypothetical protein